MITARAFDKHVDRLFGLLEGLHRAFTDAGIEYRVIGGMAVFFQVSARDPFAARLTRDVDIAVDRKDLERIAQAAETLGYRYRHVAGLHMLESAENPKVRTAVHLFFVREKVRETAGAGAGGRARRLIHRRGIGRGGRGSDDGILKRIIGFRVLVAQIPAVGFLEPGVEIDRLEF